MGAIYDKYRPNGQIPTDTDRSRTVVFCRYLSNTDRYGQIPTCRGFSEFVGDLRYMLPFLLDPQTICTYFIY